MAPSSAATPSWTGSAARAASRAWIAARSPATSSCVVPLSSTSPPFDSASGMNPRAHGRSRPLYPSLANPNRRARTSLVSKLDKKLQRRATLGGQPVVHVDADALERDRATCKAERRERVRHADARLLTAGPALVSFVLAEPREHVLVRRQPPHVRHARRGLARRQ